jgi:3-dehydroquinate dehydratase II
MRILIINGPNLNLLGTREPDVYGDLTLDGLDDQIKQYCSERNIKSTFFQSNHEGFIIDFLHDNRNKADGIVINPGALTHYSYALRDALASVALPAVEIHISDIYNREEFRKKSVTKDVCIHQISGQGTNGYFQAIDFLVNHLTSKYLSSAN